MLAIALALSASVAWGLSDFAGGLMSRRAAVLMVVFWSQLFGIPPLLVAIVASGSPTPPTADIAWGALGGLLAAIGLSSLYWAMAKGMITVVTPVAALAPVIPVLAGWISGDSLSPLHWAGVVSAVIGVLLLSIQTDKGRTRPVPRWSLAVAVLAAVAFGCWFVVMHNATASGYVWAILAQKASTATMLGVTVATLRVELRPSRRIAPALAFIGLLDLAGTALFTVSSHVGQLGVVSVLSSLYPLVTVSLALLIVKERINRYQRSGIVVALAAIGCLAS